METTLKYGSSSIELTIPDKNYQGSLLPSQVPGVSDPLAETRRALKDPIGSKPLSELVSKENRVVILASDITRPSPSSILIPPILEELLEKGVKEDQIKVVFGLGTHRKQTEEEKKALVGSDVYQQVQCIDHEMGDCQEIGVTSRGTKVAIFREVLKADFIIATANLEYHYFAGFSGGAKSLCPGVCSRETIKANHSYMMEEGAVAGRIEGNPVREDLEEVGEMVGIPFMVNAILNPKKEVVKVVAGDVTKAHRYGAAMIQDLFGIHLDSQADIVVTTPGGFPKDIDLYQSHKAMENASLAVKDGGIIIVGAKCQDGLGEEVFSSALKEKLTQEEYIRELKENFLLGRHKVSRMAKIHEHKTIYLSSDLPEHFKDLLFFPSFSSVQEALNKALEVKGENASVLLMPYGISTLPRLGPLS